MAQLLLTYTPTLLLSYTKPQKHDPRLSELRPSDLGALIGILKNRFGAKNVELKF